MVTQDILHRLLYLSFLLPHNPATKLEVLQEPGQYVIQVCMLATRPVFRI